MTFPIGAKVCWLYCPRGGYGYVIRIPAVVLDNGDSRRVKIEVERASGEKAVRFVNEKNLRAWRE